MTRWSLPRRSCYLADEGIVQVSPRHLGALLAEANLSFQRTRTWKASRDPDYEAKTARVLALCESPPPDGAVVSFDQMGPVSLRPTAGALGTEGPSRAPTRRLQPPRWHPLRLRRLRCARGPAAREAQATPPRQRQPRLHDPDPRLLPAPPADLLDPGQPLGQLDPDIRAYAAANRIELVATPTCASYLNPVECHFSVISRFVVCNADYLDWDAFAFALARHLTYRNGDHRNRRLAAVEARQRIAV